MVGGWKHRHCLTLRFLFQTCPLIPLQSDHDPDNGRKFLTCYLLPQLGDDEGPNDSGTPLNLKKLNLPWIFEELGIKISKKERKKEGKKNPNLQLINVFCQSQLNRTDLWITGHLWSINYWRDVYKRVLSSIIIG